MYCQKCGTKLNETDKFCNKCGTNIFNNSNKNIQKNNDNNFILIIIIILIVGLMFLYSLLDFRVNQKIKMTRIPFANQTIEPGTKIKSDMISYIELPIAFVPGTYYKNIDDILNKCSNYNTIIAKDSLFYTNLIIECEYLPNKVTKEE